MHTIPNRAYSGLCIALLSLAQTGHCATVNLQNATATYSQTASGDFSVGRASDGILNDNLGWAIQDGITNQTAAWETTQDVGFASGSRLTFNLYQYANYWGYTETLGRFRISITTDNRSQFADGLATGGNVTANWIVLNPDSYLAQNGTTLAKLGDNSILASGATPITDVYTVSALTFLTGISGVRLEVLSDPSLPQNGPGREPPNGNFVLSEFTMSITQVPEPGTIAFFAVGCGVLVQMRRKRSA